MQPINLIVSCTNRKKAVVPDQLRLRSLTGESLSQRLEEWLHRLTTHDTPQRRAADLYAGDHWQTAQAIPREAAEGDLDVRMWICSAGYGLIRPSDRLKPYSATFAARHPDSVTLSASGEANGSAAREWWLSLSAHSPTRGAPRSLAELAAQDPRVPVVLVASESYIQAMGSDLVGAAKTLASQDLLSILSIGADPKRLPQLKAHLLPADARFEAVVGGTRAALNARVARLLFRRVLNGARLSKELLSSTLTQLAVELPPLRRFNRRRLSDNEVRRFIENERRADPPVYKTRILRRLRASGAACEQNRFSEIFNQAVEESSDGT